MKNVHIISPSGYIEESIIKTSVNFLQQNGFCVTVGQHASSQYGRFAGTDRERIEDYEKALKNPNIDVLLCSRGGYGLQRLLPHIAPFTMTCCQKYHRLPLLVGFSDITILHNLWSLCGQVSLHAPMCKSLTCAGKLFDLWNNAVNQQKMHYDIQSHELNKQGCVCASVVGGNISVIYGLQETPYSLNLLLQAENKRTGTYPILFLEDVGERHYHIERMLLNLKYSGVFNHISGLIIGQFEDCQDDASMGCSLYQTIAQIVADYSFPTCFNFPAGHVQQNVPILFNRAGELSVASNKTILSFL